MAFNASKQTFSFAVLSAAALGGVFAARYSKTSFPWERVVGEGMPTAAAMTSFPAEHPVWGGVIAAALAVWTLLIIVQLTVRFASVNSRIYLPVPLFVIAAAGIAVPDEMLASYAAAFLLVLSMRQFITSFRKSYRFQEAFKGGFYLGFIPLLYAPGALLLLLVPVIASIYRRSGRETFVSLIGAVLPVAGAGFVYWAAGRDGGFIYRELWRCAMQPAGFALPETVPVVAAVCVSLIALLAAMSIVVFVSGRKGIRTRQRKVMTHIVLTLMVMIVSFFLPGSSLTAAPLMAVPVALAVPYAFSGRETISPSIVYCCIVVAVLALNLPPLFGMTPP